VTVRDLTTAEVAGLFGVCKQAVRYWANNGKLPTVWVHGHRRFPAAAVAELAQQHHFPLPDWLRPATATQGPAR
jgi:excisionase family DNA binding protein